MTLRLQAARGASPFAVFAAVTLALAAAGCGGPADLQRDAVTTIPAGDAKGTAFSGRYAVEVRTTDCEGACAADTRWGTVSVCDVGDVDSAWVTITQDAGKLEASWEEPLSLLRGGVSEGGAFEMGGYGTQSGGALEISLRVSGTIGEAKLEAEARSWTVGFIEGGTLDCVGRYAVSAPRPTGEPAELGPKCQSDGDCAGDPGTNCNFETDTCQAPGADGSPCGGDDDCQGGNCNFETDACQAPQPDGSRCGGDDDCEGGNCNFELDQCRAAGPSGAPCGGHDDCTSGHCVFDTDTCG